MNFGKFGKTCIKNRNIGKFGKTCIKPLLKLKSVNWLGVNIHRLILIPQALLWWACPWAPTVGPTGPHLRTADRATATVRPPDIFDDNWSSLKNVFWKIQDGLFRNGHSFNSSKYGNYWQTPFWKRPDCDRSICGPQEPNLSKVSGGFWWATIRPIAVLLSRKGILSTIARLANIEKEAFDTYPILFPDSLKKANTTHMIG